MDRPSGSVVGWKQRAVRTGNQVTEAPLTLREISAAAAFVVALPSTLRGRISADEARRIIRLRLARREADFVRTARRLLSNRRGPSAWMMRNAGIELGDIVRLVESETLEGALLVLARHGVYLTAVEAKGRVPLRRGSATYDDEQVAVSAARPGQPAFGSGASGGTVRPVPLSCSFESDLAVDVCAYLAARGLDQRWRHGFWEVPGGSSLRHRLWLARVGPRLEVWFSQVDPASITESRYRWSERLLGLGSRLIGAPLPRARFVPVDDPGPIVHWIDSQLRSGAVPHLWTFVSSAARVCQVAASMGVELRGAQLTANGEPITTDRVRSIQEAGAVLGGYYGTAESGPIGYGCLSPEAPDDLHQIGDCHATVLAPDGDSTGDLPVGAVLLSSLRPSTPQPLLNIATGDRAVVSERTCGCALEGIGWTTHLHSIRSYEKLTAGGMTFLDVDVIRVLEHDLPARFGGGPTDYQLVELEGVGGKPKLRLLAHPRIGQIDPDLLVESFLQSIGETGAAQRVMAMRWRQNRIVEVERRPPFVTGGGKLLHIHRTI
jgi:hypothetical protein